MLRRYLVKYIGDDSCNHEERVWAKDHHDAKKKIRSQGVDTITGVRRASNPFVIAAIVVAVLVLVIIEIAH